MHLVPAFRGPPTQAKTPGVEGGRGEDDTERGAKMEVFENMGVHTVMMPGTVHFTGLTRRKHERLFHTNRQPASP